MSSPSSDTPSTAVSSGRVQALLATVRSYGEQGRRYLELALVLSGLLALAILCVDHASWTLSVLRGSVVVYCGFAFWAVRRGVAWPTIGVTSALLFYVQLLGIAGFGANGNWPNELVFVPLACGFGTLVGGTLLGVVMTCGAAAMVLGFEVLGYFGHELILPIQLTNWLAVVVLFQLFSSHFLRLLRHGVAELERSNQRLLHTQSTLRQLSALLTQRVAASVEAIAQALNDSPERTRGLVGELWDLLDRSRTALPPESEFAPATLGASIARVRASAANFAFLLTMVLSFVQVIRYTTLQVHPNYVVVIAGNAFVLTVAAIRYRWVARRRTIDMLFWAGITALATPTFWSWVGRTEALPPNLVAWGAGSVVVAAAISEPLGVLMLAVMVAMTTAGLVHHGRAFWYFPALIAIAYGAFGTTLRRWPSTLLSQLELRREQAYENVKQRRRIVATLFHDLANPLQVISNCLELCDGDPKAEDRAQIAAMANRMRGTLKAATDSRVERREIEVFDVWKQVVSLFEERARRKDLTIALSGPSDVRVCASPSLLQDSVLANLVSNALKFAPRGSTIELSTRIEGDRVQLACEDRGPGLPEEVLQALDRGSPVPSSLGLDGERGNGYGLTLVRDYVASMGGNFQLVSRQGGGLSARVSLPAR